MDTIVWVSGRETRLKMNGAHNNDVPNTATDIEDAKNDRKKNTKRNNRAL